MAKLYFYYSAMNAGKSVVLLQSSYNYRERGMSTLLLKPAVDQRDSRSKIVSRIGLTAEAEMFTREQSLLSFIKDRSAHEPLACVLIDEAQFLTYSQVKELGEVVDDTVIACSLVWFANRFSR